MKLYTVTGQYIIDELQAPCTLEQAIKKAEEYTQSRNQGVARIVMLVDTNAHPLEYVFGVIGHDHHSRGEFYEVCRIEEHSPYIGTAIIHADRLNEEFEKHYSHNLDFEKKGNAQYAHPETRVAWQYYLAGWRKAEQVL